MPWHARCIACRARSTAASALSDSMEDLWPSSRETAMRNAWQILGFQRVLLPGEPRVSAPRRPPRAHANLKAALGDREWELDADATPPVAAHVVTSRVGYTHHGIHMGNGRVVHYSGLSRGWRGGPVEEVSLAEFARGRRVRVRVHVDA